MRLLDIVALIGLAYLGYSNYQLKEELAEQQIRAKQLQEGISAIEENFDTSIDSTVDRLLSGDF